MMTILLMIKIPGKVPCEISLMNSMRQPVCEVWIAKIYEPKEMHAQNKDIESYDSSDLNKHLLSGEHGFCPFPLQELGRNKASEKIFPCFSIFRPRESYNKTPFEEHSSPSWVSGSTEGMLAEPPSGDVAQRQKTAAADPGPCNGRVVSSTSITSTAVPVGRFCYDT